MQAMKSALVLLLVVANGTLVVGRSLDTDCDTLISAVTTRPWPGQNYPPLPQLSDAMRARVCEELGASSSARAAYLKLNAADRRNVEWFEGIDELERCRAIWSLLSCL